MKQILTPEKYASFQQYNSEFEEQRKRGKRDVVQGWCDLKNKLFFLEMKGIRKSKKNLKTNRSKKSRQVYNFIENNKNLRDLKNSGSY